jgi:hypothetical protein
MMDSHAVQTYVLVFGHVRLSHSAARHLSIQSNLPAGGMLASQLPMVKSHRLQEDFSALTPAAVFSAKAAFTARRKRATRHARDQR